jgi:hypothetical protein
MISSAVIARLDPAFPIVELGVPANGMRGTNPRMTPKQKDSR